MLSSCSDDEQSDCTSDYEYEYVDEEDEEEEELKNDRVVGVLAEFDNLKLPAHDMETRRPELGIGVGSICTRCYGEEHLPVQDCDTVQAWMVRRYQLPTVDRAYIVSCLKRFLRETAARFDISIDEAGILCRRYQWDLDRIARTGGQQGTTATGTAQCVQCKTVATRSFFYKRQWRKRDSPMGGMCIPCQYAHRYHLPDYGKFTCTQCNKRKQPDEFSQQGEGAPKNNSIYTVCTACESPSKKPPPLDIRTETLHKCILCVKQKKAGQFNILECDHEKSSMLLCQSCWDILLFPTLDMRNRLKNSAPTMVREVYQNAHRVYFGRKVDRLTPARDEVVTLGHIRNKQQTDLKPPPADHSYSCDVCLNDDLPSSDMMSMACGHAFCLDCWRGYIQVQLEAANLETTCPSALCPIRVTEIQIERVAPDLLPTFETMNLQSFIQANGESLRVCPGPECDAIAVQPRVNLFEDDDAGFHCRACQTSFCFHCGAAPHVGRPCTQQVIVVENEALNIGEVENVARLDAPGHQGRLNDETPTMQELDGGSNNNKADKRVKQCPTCKVDIQKIGGCNRMSCKCGYHFCWVCAKEYANYGSHFCGRAAQEAPRMIGHIDINLSYVRRTLEEDTDTITARIGDLQQQIKGLERYAHFYNRFYVHGESQRFAESQCPCLQERAHDYMRMVDIKTGTDIDFIRKANETLVASRCLLKYTYCSAYNHNEQQLESSGGNTGSGAFAHLGFLHLERLERFTEELSEVTEHAVSRRHRTRVLDLISIVRKCMEAVADFEKFS